MKTHELKTHPEPFGAMTRGDKRHEFRNNDRDFKKGDEIFSREWDPEVEQYTGFNLRVKILYANYGPAFGIPEGFVAMSTGRPTVGFNPKARGSE